MLGYPVMGKRETVKTAVHFDIAEWSWLKQEAIRAAARGEKESLRSLVHEGIELVRKSRAKGTICPFCHQKLPDKKTI